jgi:hypothetical protein
MKIPGLYKLSGRGQELNVGPHKPAVRLPQDTKSKDYRGQVDRRGCE